MTYTPTNWQDGDIITAAKLNRLENGLAAVQTDTTLTQSGEAADSKAAGDAIDALKEDLGEHTRNINSANVGRYYTNNVGTIGYDANNSKNFGISAYIDCEAETDYTISFLNVESIVGINVSAYICTLDSNGDFISKQSVLMRGNAVAIYTTPASAVKMHVYVYYSSGITDISNGKIQIEKGSVPTPYISGAIADDEYARQGELIYLDVFETSGYFGSDGTIQTATSQNEVYTGIYDVSQYDKFCIALSYTTSRKMWLSYCSYDADGAFIERVVVTDQTTTKYGTRLSLDSNVAFIAFSYRKFTDGTFTVVTTTSADKALACANEVKANLETFEESLENITPNAVQIGSIPFRFKPCYDHLFVNMAPGRITIPHESIYHVRLSKALGFNMIEANVASTADGVYIVNHLDHGAFGNFFDHVDGVTDISETLLSSVTWAWVEQNVRYHTSLAKYATRPCTLEEFLTECRQQNIIPFVTSTDSTVVEIVEQYMGKDNYVAYEGDRSKSPSAVIFHWKSLTTKAQILAYCESIGKPFVYGMANPTSFSDSELQDIIDTLHANGYWIGTSYADSLWYKYSYMGFDVNGTQWRVNRIESGNVCNLDSVFGFGEFSYSNAALTNGELVYSADGTISPTFTGGAMSVGMVDLQIEFNGTITVPRIGLHNSATYTSDGSIPLFIAVPILNDSPQITISVTAGTSIKDISYKVSKF